MCLPAVEFLLYLNNLRTYRQFSKYGACQLHLFDTAKLAQNLLCALLLTTVGLLCIELLSCVYFCYLMCIVLLYMQCCLTCSSCRIAGKKSVTGRSCDRPHRHGVFLVSLCLKANAEMVPNTRSYYCVLLM
jgi:hypothetical protein